MSLCALVIAVPLGIYFARQPQEAEAGWFNGSGSEGTWKFRRKISIDHAKVMGSSALTDFPLSLNTAFSELATHAQTDGDDIVFTATDGTTKLSHELEYYAAATGKLTAWIKIPSLSTTQDTSFYMYYGNPNAANQESVTDTWESNFMAVWHFGEDPGSGDFLDSTSNNNDCQTIDGTDTWASGDRVEGKLGYAVDFALESRYLNCGNNAVLDIAEEESFSVIGWLKERDSDGTSKQAFSKSSGNPGGTYAGFQIQLRDDLTSNIIQMRLNDGVADEVNLSFGANNTGLTGQWEFVAASIDRSNASSDISSTYLDAQYNDHRTAINYDGSLITTNNLYINANHDASVLGAMWGGWDELWLYNAAVSETYIQTLFFNQNEPTTFFSSFGEPEQNTDPIAWWKLDEGANNSCVSPAIQYVDTATGAGNGTTVSIAKADLAGLSNNDLVVVALAHNEVAGAGGSWTLSGWTFVSQKTTTLGSDLNTAVAYKVITDVSGEAASWDFAVSASGDKSATAIALRGVNTSSPVDATVVAADGANNNQPDAPDITTNSNGAMVVSALHLIDPASIDMYASAPIGMINAGGSNQNGADTAFTSIAYKDVPTSGAYAISNWLTDDSNLTSEHHTNTIAFAKTSTKTGDACDGTQEKLHGTNSGATWQAASACVMGSSCLLFDGSANVVTITNASSIDFDQILSTGVSASFWVNPSSDGDNDVGRIFTKGSHFYCRTDSESGGFVDLECGIDLATGTDPVVNVSGGLPIGSWSHVEVTYGDDADDDLLVYINGELKGTGNGSGAPASTDTNPLLIGGDTGTNYHGYLDDFKIFAYERTAAQVKTDYLKGAAAAGSNVAVGIGGTAMPDPVVWWRFDEMTGTTANNAAGASNNGTITSGAWTSNGKYEGALTFTASTSVTATITDPAYNNTLSLWVYPTTSAASKTLVTSGKLTTNGSSQPVYGGCIGTALPLTTWTHIVAVSNGSGSCTLYQNGIETSTAGTGVTFGTSLNVGGSSFTGTIDDFKLFNTALTADQVKVDYNVTSALNAGTGVNEQAALIDGDYQSSLVGYWPLDENTGTSTTANKAGSANGTLTSITESSWVPGKHGSALSLDGSADYVDIGTGPATVRSVSFWTHPVTTTEYFINLTSTTDYIWSSAGTLTATGLSSPTIYVNGVPSTTLTAGVWQHVAVVTATAENASNFDIGRTQNTNYLEGTIDDVKLFSSTLTQAQVAYEYNRGAPLAWYRLDECQGTTTNDASGHSFTGTLTIGSSGTHTSPGTCDSGQSSHAWNTGTVGKFERSLAFDGTDDYVSVSDAAHLRFDSGSQDFSLFAWVKRNASGATHYIVSKEDADNDGYRLQFDSGNTVTCSIDAIDITSTTTITDTNWHHLGCVIDRDGDGQVYIDGLPDGSPAAISSEAMATTTALRFGSRSYSAASYLNGLLDDVRIYNYALSPEQVKSVITGGAVRFE